MSEPQDELRVVHRPTLSRFEIRVGDTLAGHAQYREEQGRRVFTHTEVDPLFSGRGLGSRLIGFALDETRREGLQAVPVCSFVSAFIERHPEYGEFVAPLA